MSGDGELPRPAPRANMVTLIADTKAAARTYPERSASGARFLGHSLDNRVGAVQPPLSLFSVTC